MADEEREEKRPEPGCEDADDVLDASQKAEEKPEAKPEDDIEALKKRATERDEFLDLLQRTAADYSNYRKRIERDKAAWSDAAVAEFVLKILPALDDFDRALAHADESTSVETFAQGIRLIENKLYDVLKSCDIEPIVPEWQRFDPAEHQAVVVEETDKVPDQTVTVVLLKGYRMRGKVLRPAQVKVARKPHGTGEKSEPGPAQEDKTGEETDDDADV